MDGKAILFEMLSTHFKFMEMALKQAETALEEGETPVGCLFVYDGEKILSWGRNSTNDTLSGISHAELNGIDEILHSHGLTQKENVKNPEIERKIKKLFAKVDLYVTIEPCVMCGLALAQLGIRRVFFGAGNSRFGGNGGVMRVNTGSYIAYPDFGRERAIMLLRHFYAKENESAPQPRDKTTQRRTVEYGNFPVMRYDRYLDKEEFKKMYGEENMYRWDRMENGKTEVFEGVEVETWIDPLM